MSLKTLYPKKKLVTTAGTRVQLETAVNYLNKLKIKALAANTGVIYVGDVTVSSTSGHYALAAGQELDLTDLFSNEHDVIDVSKIYLDSSVNAEGVSFLYVK